ncbi:MAG: tRNA (adenosine(37)-N6)-threonylcarbamoyltransferase complex ATPase subunit type 1 TsaE [Patescibacteria group bacterium]|jgi:tRNA threonylcarbamoyladenosine biosynthesis protein TsaE|nr:tRNA (adenosine(37)-N6)-threonylcarbamoyltransferase complex ATPase subunit type 1 TsaE [Patescibacteria group bacterium]
MKIRTIITKNSQETFDLAKNIAKDCTGSEVFALNGDLGAGKTAFCQGLAAGFKVKTQVNSPTFNILKLYQTNLKNINTFCHIDAYRLNNGNDLINLGFSDYLEDENTVIAIEWPENVSSALPKRVKNIYFKTLSENKREITLDF